MKHLLAILIITTITLGSCKHSELIFPINSRDITKEYIENKHKSNKKYKYKTLIVEGRVSHIYKNSNGNTVVFMAYKRDSYGISCTLKRNYILKEPLKQNDLLEIKGFCIGIDENIMMNDCVIIKK